MVAYEGNEPYVFISYAHKDKDKVLPIIQGLQDRGFRVWYDEGIEVGNEWPDFIAEHLENCACVLSFVSRNFGDSKNCRQEFTFSQNLQKENSIVYLEDPKVLRAGLRMQLSNLHALYYENNSSKEKLLNDLSTAKVMKPCLGEAAAPGKASAVAPVKLAEPAAEELYKRGKKLYERKEFDEAVPLLQMSAEQGYAPAQFWLGVCYDGGKGTQKNCEEAVKWYRRAAEQGHANAQNNLGFAYHRGRGVSRNLSEARRWYQKAIEQGSAAAKANIRSL